MEFKEILSYWKLILGLVVVVSTTTISVVTWAEDQKTLIRAEQQLIHNELYQESRIQRKRDIISDNQKLIAILTSDDDELTLAEQKQLDRLEAEILRLEQDIEDIMEKLATNE